MLSDTPNSKILDKVIYTGRLDLIEFVSAAESPVYRDYYLSKKVHCSVIETALIEDLFLRRKIVEFLFDCLNFYKLSPATFHTYRVIGLIKVLSSCPEEVCHPLDKFVGESEEILNGIKCGQGAAKAFLRSFNQYCKESDEESHRFESDAWKVEWYNLPKDRDYLHRFNAFYFSGIKNSRNKTLVKIYIDYCLTNTDNSVQTIQGKLTSLKSVLNLLDKPYDEWTVSDARQVGELLKDAYSNRRTVCSRIITLFHFNDFLLLHDYISINAIKELRILTHTGDFEYKTTAIDHSVVLQIFNVLDKVPDERVVLAFLMVYCTGMRVSEACGICWDCTEKRGETTYLKYYSLKTKKDVYNIIPPSLYDRIEEYKNTHEKNALLFPATKAKNKRTSKSMGRGVFFDRINETMVEYGVKNPDGTPYHFTPHSFRHLIAVKMRENKVPIQVIQEQLHHESVEMTMAYIEYIDKSKIKKMTEYINVHGDVQKIPDSISAIEDVQYANYIRKKLNAQMLPNGLCSRPVRLGQCPHGNTCLTCPDFRTTKANLECHKQQLQRIDSFLEEAKKHDWLPQIQTNEAIRKNLLTIINTLEEMKDA